MMVGRNQYSGLTYGSAGPSAAPFAANPFNNVLMMQNASGGLQFGEETVLRNAGAIDHHG